MTNKYPNEIEVDLCVVVGGDSEDPAKNQNGGFRLRSSKHGPNITHEDLMFVPGLGTSSQGSVQSNNPPPERGTRVATIKFTGQGGSSSVIPIGIIQNEVAKSGGTPGNANLNQFFQDAIDHVTNKKSAPKSIKTQMKEGVEIRQPVDSKMWSHSLVKGLPSGLGIKPTAGIYLDQVKNISTALQHFSQIPMPSMLGSLPGVAMSLSGMLGALQSSGAFDRILSKLPTDAVDAFQSLSDLVVDVETSSGSSYGTSNRVNPAVYLANAEDMLSNCRDLSDIVECFSELQSNTQLFGQDTLGEVEVVKKTPNGNVTIRIDATGGTSSTINVELLVAAASANANTSNANTVNVTVQAAASQPQDSDSQNTVQNILGFASMLLSASQAFSMSGKPMFGRSAKTHFDMVQRLNPGSGGTATDMMKILHTGEKEVKFLREMAKVVREGGNPLTRKVFKK